MQFWPLACLLLCLEAGTKAALPAHEVLWDAQAVPVLDRYCFKCHAGVRQKSGLDLRSLETILRGGEHGPAVIPGNPDESRLIEFLDPQADPHMPPEGKKQLTADEIESLRNWIAKLPPSSSASSSSTNIAWVPDYLAKLRRLAVPAEVPPESMPPNEAIDSILQTDWREGEITPAAPCDDRTFLRRIYLDLIGRIPTTSEADSFLASPEPARREHLIETLLDSPEHSRHMREVFDVFLLGRPKGRGETARRNNGWFTYLDDSFRSNRPWNEIVREIILARSTNAPARGASQFLYERRNNYQAMAEAVAPITFGVQIGCAQCHNHPLSWEIEQRHYWGLVAAFNRGKNVDTSSGIGVSESAIGGFVQFANLKKESQPAALAFLNGKTVSEKRPEQNEKEADDPELYLVPPAKEGQKTAAAAVPKFSRREALADAATHDNPMLARAFVNRMWQILLGRGIVHPVDQIDSRHRPSHPLLLDWLATDFERNNYDMKRLIRGIVRSRTYQLDSKTPGRTPPPPSSFARALDKPLSAEQLSQSLLVATGYYPPKEGRAGDQNVEDLHRALVKKFPELMPPVYNPSLEQALFWSNSSMVDALLKPQGDNTASQLLSLDSPEARISKAFFLVLGRAPEPDEMNEMKTLFASSSGETAAKNLLWALLASAEFQFNH